MGVGRLAGGVVVVGALRVVGVGRVVLAVLGKGDLGRLVMVIAMRMRNMMKTMMTMMIMMMMM